jgi:hypothetical protein
MPLGQPFIKENMKSQQGRRQLSKTPASFRPTWKLIAKFLTTDSTTSRQGI